MPVGALSNASYAIAQLGYVAGPKRHLLEAYGKGVVRDVTVGAVMAQYRSRSLLIAYSTVYLWSRCAIGAGHLRLRQVRFFQISNPSGLPLTSQSFWLILSIVAFARDIRKTHFNLNHWSAAYPIGAYGLACSQLTIDFDSRAFAVVTTIVAVVLFIYWILLVLYTIPSIASGELFLASVVEEREEEERNRESQDGLLRAGGSGQNGNDRTSPGEAQQA